MATFTRDGVDIGEPLVPTHLGANGRRAFARGFRIRAWDTQKQPPFFYRTKSLQRALEEGWRVADQRIAAKQSEATRNG